MKRRIIAAFVSMSLLSMLPISAQAKPKPQMTPMELQAIQSKEFETSKQVLFGCAMSVFQDLGYTIEGADVNTGFITARSPTKNTTSFLEALAYESSTGFTKVTAFVEDFPNGRAKIRLNFVVSSSASSRYGQQFSNETPILDSSPYNVAWDKIDEALFVRGVLTSAPSKQDSNTKPADQTPPIVSK